MSHKDMHPMVPKILELTVAFGLDGKNMVAVAVALLHLQHEAALEHAPDYKALYEKIGGDAAFPTQIEKASAYLAFISDKVNKLRSSESSQIEA